MVPFTTACTFPRGFGRWVMGVVSIMTHGTPGDAGSSCICNADIGELLCGAVGLVLGACTSAADLLRQRTALPCQPSSGQRRS